MAALAAVFRWNAAGEPLWSRCCDTSSRRLQTSAPDRVIDVRIAVTEPVDCDRARIGQLVSNLVGNAIDHGAPDQPIEVTAATHDGWFEFSVTNAGDQIPPAVA